MTPRVATTAPAAVPDPTAAELRGLVHELETSWVARVTIRRQSSADIGWRQIYVSIDDERVGDLVFGEEITREVQPGKHRIRVHNTLFWKNVEFTVGAGEHVSFSAVNLPGFMTYSLLTYFLGTNPLYLSFERDTV